MISIIRILDDTTINQIAAGEVIENPASVIKELVENAIDAEATSISIEIAASGRHLIRVSDNGFGMNSDDALLAFERHATSKVRTLKDLDQLDSMGFRGEALPSIASIAKVRLITRPRDCDKGTLVEIHGGKIMTHTSIPCELGTSIEVQDLFYNVPARKKFLKSVRQDFAEIQKIIIQIAYGNPLVHFSFVSDKELILDIPLVTNHLERARQLLQESVYENMVLLAFEEGEVRMEGLIGKPTLHRPNRTGQELFINGRPVSSWEVAESIRAGYGTSLPERRYPLFHLHLHLPPHTFDVNVHPQKKEVRFCHLEHLKEVLRKGVMKILNEETHESSYIIPEPISWAVSEPMIKEEPYFRKEIEIPLPIEHTIPSILGILPYYLLLEEESGIQLLDIQRAKKRILYEEMLAKKTMVSKQLLLVPLTIHVAEEESILLGESLAKLTSIGFEIRPFGKTTFIIEAIPSFIEEKEIESLLHEMLKTKEFEKSVIQKVRREKRILLKLEAEHLIKKLMACQEPLFTPTGQSIMAHISYEDIGRFFK